MPTRFAANDRTHPSMNYLFDLVLLTCSLGMMLATTRALPLAGVLMFGAVPAMDYIAISDQLDTASRDLVHYGLGVGMTCIAITILGEASDRAHQAIDA